MNTEIDRLHEQLRRTEENLRKAEAERDRAERTIEHMRAELEILSGVNWMKPQAE